jgi:hypothetical protein
VLPTGRMSQPYHEGGRRGPRILWPLPSPLSIGLLGRWTGARALPRGRAGRVAAVEIGATARAEIRSILDPLVAG